MTVLPDRTSAPGPERGNDAVLLLNMGGPDATESIRPFLQNLFSDREIIRFPVPAFMQSALARVIARARSKKLVPVYEAMGGCSPQLPYTFEQGRLLEAALSGSGYPARVYVGMRYWKPFIRETIEEMIRDGVTRAVVLPLYPQFATATTGSSMNEVDRVVRDLKPDIEWIPVESWETHPPYVKVLADLIREQLATMAEEDSPVILFSAHSLPMKFVDRGDPYPRQIQATLSAVLGELDWAGESRLAYQSKVGPIKWLGPSTPDALRTLATEGHRSVVVVPISFVSEHIETLEELDVEYRNLATSLGITTYARAAAPNARPDFIAALASLVKARLGATAKACV